MGERPDEPEKKVSTGSLSSISSMRKAHTLVDMDTKLQMLFPPMQVIPEEKVFHISGEKDVID
jgi:hypothetical protein